MLEILQFVFSSGWVFSGVLILLAVICDAIIKTAATLARKRGS